MIYGLGIMLNLWTYHILFSKNRAFIKLGLSEFGVQIEHGYSFILALIANTFKALKIAKLTRIKQLERCLSLYMCGSSSTGKYVIRCPLG